MIQRINESINHSIILNYIIIDFNHYSICQRFICSNPLINKLELLKCFDGAKYEFQLNIILISVH